MRGRLTFALVALVATRPAFAGDPAHPPPAPGAAALVNVAADSTRTDQASICSNSPCLVRN